jgi:crossover junction endodeoxyribonuclease RuvC
MSVCGNGLASKEQIQRMVKTLFALPEMPQNDAADALALAICHANSRTVISINDNQTSRPKVN